jgi:class 3 adenylate cyclase
MEKNEAESILEDFLKRLKAERPINFQESFESKYKKCFDLKDGSHIFFFGGPYVGNPHCNPEAIIVRHDKKAYEIYGAIAKVFLNLPKIPCEQIGNPVTGERWLGSGPGRYQFFDRGIIKWEGTSRMGGIEDIAHPVLFERDPHEGIEAECIVGFADIRGFTKWVLDNEAQKVQELIFNIEEVFQKHFAKPWFPELFIKAVGDGFMIVLEKERYQRAVSELKTSGSKIKKNRLSQSQGFVSDFINACYECGKELIGMLNKNNLTLGFGVEIGRLKNVLVLGRWDYLGEAVNNASKYQNEAIGSLIFSKECFNEIELRTGIEDKEIEIKSGRDKKTIIVKELKIKLDI